MKTVYKNGLCLSKRKTVDQLTQNGLSKRFIKTVFQNGFKNGLSKWFIKTVYQRFINCFEYNLHI